jgi:hypothetical protein
MKEDTFWLLVLLVGGYVLYDQYKKQQFQDAVRTISPVF